MEERGGAKRRRKRREESPAQDLPWGKGEDDGDKEKKEAPKPVFKKSGLLRKDALANSVSSAPGGYVEAVDAAMPQERWKLFPFKGDQALDTIELHRKSHYLLGRDRSVADIPTDHPSCSKRHAVVQFRKRPVGGAVRGEKLHRVLPYVMDLGSSNGTFLNGERLGKERYYELREKDILTFALSTREYVVMKDKPNGK